MQYAVLQLVIIECTRINPNSCYFFKRKWAESSRFWRLLLPVLVFSIVSIRGHSIIIWTRWGGWVVKKQPIIVYVQSKKCPRRGSWVAKKGKIMSMWLLNGPLLDSCPFLHLSSFFLACLNMSNCEMQRNLMKSLVWKITKNEISP